MIVAALIITGFFVGLISAFFGVGGGILIVPVLYTLFPKAHAGMVIATSLGVIFINTIINLTNFYRMKKRPDWSFTLWVGIGLAIGVALGGSATIFISARILKYLFATLLLVIAIKSILSKGYKQGNIQNWSWNRLIATKVTIFSFFAGILSGMTGVGGGATMIPIFISVAKIPTRWLSVYSNAGMFFATASGMITYMLQPSLSDEVGLFSSWHIGQVNWGIIGCLAFGALFSSKLGTRLTEVISPNTTKWLFSVLLLLLSLKLFLTA